MKSQKIISIVFASLLLLSCNSEAEVRPQNVSNTDTAAKETVPAETEYVVPDPNIEAVDGGGKDFAILTRDAENSSYVFPYSEVKAEGENGDIINDAVFRRNSAVSQKYNVNIIGIADNGYETKLKNAINADSPDYDAALPMISAAHSLASGGFVYNISELPIISTENPWWMKSLTESVSIAGRNYFIIGDLNLSALNSVGVIFFNKSLAEKMDITDIYDTVKKGNWTLDKLTEYCQNITNDVNGDGVYNGEDAYGLTCNVSVWKALFTGTDAAMIEKNQDDIPVLVWENEKCLQMLTRITEFLNDKTSTILVNQFPELQNKDGWGPASIRMFSENRALFWIEILYGLPELRNMGQDFGILPMPKYDENQEKYTTYINEGHGSATVVPVTNRDLDLTCRIIEDMGYQSMIKLRPEYYEKTLKLKQSRDEESAAMLDIIYSNIKFDMSMVIFPAFEDSIRSSIIKNTNDFASKFASMAPNMQKKIDTSIESYTKDTE